MINYIHIKNYRNVEDLRLNNFGQVNLITGKNNTGKSSILEALAIYVDNASSTTLRNILIGRGEYTSIPNEYMRNPNFKGIERINMNILSSFFPDRNFSYDEGKYIFFEGDDKVILLKGILYEFDNATLFSDEEYGIGFQITINDNQELKIPLNRRRIFESILTRSDMSSNNNYQYVQTRNIDRDTNATLFDKIALSEMENDVVEALKIIEPKIERIAFVGDSIRNRNAVARIKG